MSTRRDLYLELCEYLETERQQPRIRLSDSSQISQALLPGDVLLLDVQAPLDHCLRTISSSRWSRTALYLGRPHEIASPELKASLSEFVSYRVDSQLVISCDLKQGLKVQHLDELSQAHLRICRPRNLTDRQLQGLIEHLVSRLTLSASRSWFTLLLVALPWSWLPARWRLGLARLLSGSLFRTLTGTLIAESFVFAHYPVLPLLKRQEKNQVRIYNRQPGIFFAADFDHSPYFDVMKFPFVDTDDHPGMRLQPWSQHEVAEQATPTISTPQNSK